MTRDGLNHYERLQVPRDASTREIRDAYRARARVVHPDRGEPGVIDPLVMAALNQAWFVLRDPDRRADYDRTLASHNVVDAPAAASSPTNDSAEEVTGATTATFRNLRRLIVIAVILLTVSAVVLTAIGIMGAGDRP